MMTYKQEILLYHITHITGVFYDRAKDTATDRLERQEVVNQSNNKEKCK